MNRRARRQAAAEEKRTGFKAPVGKKPIHVTQMTYDETLSFGGTVPTGRDRASYTEPTVVGVQDDHGNIVEAMAALRNAEGHIMVLRDVREATNELLGREDSDDRAARILAALLMKEKRA